MLYQLCLINNQKVKLLIDDFYPIKEDDGVLDEAQALKATIEALKNPTKTLEIDPQKTIEIKPE
jgi:hypothetical protein